jgi:glucose dehydrogenase
VCSRRILSATLDARLIALDADWARPHGLCCNGAVNLRDNLGDVRTGEHYVTSAPLVLGTQVTGLQQGRAARHAPLGVCAPSTSRAANWSGPSIRCRPV